MLNSSKNGKLLKIRRWLRIALSFDGLTFLNVMSDISICSPDLSFKCPLTYFTVIGRIAPSTHIYIPLHALSQKVRDLSVRKH